MKKKILKLLMLFISVFAIFSCGAEDKKEMKTVDFYLSATEEHIIYAKLKEIAAKFEEKEGIKVNILAGGGAEYESTMKTRMASNDLPDIFSTHGWSVLRYSEYLEKLDNQSWVKDINPLIKGAITDKEGHIYVLPVNMDITGMVYNVTILEKLGVNVDDIKTWDDFLNVAKKAVENGYIGIHMGAKDANEGGRFFDWAGSSFLITPKDNEAQNLLNGVFNTQKWEELSNLLVQFRENNLINKDFVTATPDDTARALADNKALFTFATNGMIREAQEYNPEAKIAFMPTPARYADDEPTLITGEEFAFGVWKDSKVKEEALKFIDYLALPENIKLINESIGAAPGLLNVEVDNGDLTEYYNKYVNTKTVPYLDRVYLPGGMWSTLCDVGTGILTEQLTVKDGVAKLKADYEKLYNAQK
ncbi:ABC transporter substrate-binding protein [Oceanivirga salmonicida]|uniref:ABC transporter substrate-binding protein n=1 Tax=Oceanivirga salmonicida TaxID=1769291 RepID=UPI00082FB2C6|nr:ABC transporter substrate-binding protein [Oceanivirga salmonicida]